MPSRQIYRIIFLNQGKVYEIYAREVSSSGLYGFVEVGDLVFGETGGVVVDPSEEKLRDEFARVKRFHLPMHAVMRVDEVDKRGVCKIRDMDAGDTVMPFPLPPQSGKKTS